MRVLIPMAGRGDRFVDKGYKDPKPLIKVNGKMIIEYILVGVICFSAGSIHNKKKKHTNCEHSKVIVVHKHKHKKHHHIS